MSKNQIGHDRLFKELLETFFAEFIRKHLNIKPGTDIYFVIEDNGVRFLQ